MDIYFARDIDRTLNMFYQEKPKIDENGYWCNGIPQWKITIDQQLFPHLTCNTEPAEFTENDLRSCFKQNEVKKVKELSYEKVRNAFDIQNEN